MEGSGWAADNSTPPPRLLKKMRGSVNHFVIFYFTSV
jgi:hypothetical protein